MNGKDNPMTVLTWLTDWEDSLMRSCGRTRWLQRVSVSGYANGCGEAGQDRTGQGTGGQGTDECRSVSLGHHRWSGMEHSTPGWGHPHAP